jgi:hypothetical protein
MNTKSIISVAILGTLALTGVASAGSDITVHGQQSPRSQDERAVQACVDAFTGEALAGKNLKVRAVVRGENQIFITGSFVDRMDVSMVARARSTGAQLASAQCTVNRDAKVETIKTRISDSALLARLGSHDITLASIVR